MDGGCRSIFHRLNCITAPKIICPAYGEAACSYSNTASLCPTNQTQPRLLELLPSPGKAQGLGLGSTGYGVV